MNPAPPGWYPDPQDPGAQRWFDGQAWTGDRRGPGGQSPARGSSRTTRVLVVAASVVGGLILTGVLAAIAIPLYLNQRNRASLASLSSLTCAQVASDAVAMSMKEATADQIPLITLTDTAVVQDGRAVLKVPQPGSEAFVMSCRGTGGWKDGATSLVTVEVHLTSDRQEALSLSWEE